LTLTDSDSMSANHLHQTRLEAVIWTKDGYDHIP